jgi:hypothetical protein
VTRSEESRKTCYRIWESFEYVRKMNCWNGAGSALIIVFSWWMSSYKLNYHVSTRLWMHPYKIYMFERWSRSCTNSSVAFTNLNLPSNKQMERKIIEWYKCHLHFPNTSKEMCACLLRRFLLDRCILQSSLFVREQSQLSFSILITVSILKGQFSLHKHLEVIKLKGQSVDKR